jgi:hypothetical protein
MRRTGHVSFALLFLALAVSPAHAQQSGSATCDASALDARSYALTTEAQALNVLRPREPWWERFEIQGPRELRDVNEGAVRLAERARDLDDRNLLAYGYLARQYVVAAVDASKAEDTWRKVLDNGGAIVWIATLDRIDLRSAFIVAFDNSGVRIFRFGDLAGAVRTYFGVPDFPMPEREVFWRALGGCIPTDIAPAAEIPWSNVREIRPTTLTLRFKLNTRVEIESDNRRRRADDEVEIHLHGRTGMYDPRFRMAPYLPPLLGPRSVEADPGTFHMRVLQMLQTLFKLRTINSEL